MPTPGELNPDIPVAQKTLGKLPNSLSGAELPPGSMGASVILVKEALKDHESGSDITHNKEFLEKMAHFRNGSQLFENSKDIGTTIENIEAIHLDATAATKGVDEKLRSGSVLENALQPAMYNAPVKTGGNQSKTTTNTLSAPLSGKLSAGWKKSLNQSKSTLYTGPTDISKASFVRWDHLSKDLAEAGIAVTKIDGATGNNAFSQKVEKETQEAFALGKASDPIGFQQKRENIIAYLIEKDKSLQFVPQAVLYKKADGIIYKGVYAEVTRANVIKYGLDKEDIEGVDTFIASYSSGIGDFRAGSEIYTWVDETIEQDKGTRFEHTFLSVAGQPDSGLHHFVHEKVTGLDMHPIKFGEDFWKIGGKEKFAYIQANYPGCLTELQIDEEKVRAIESFFDQEDENQRDKDIANLLGNLQQLREEEITRQTEVALKEALALKYSAYMSAMTEGPLHYQLPLESIEMNRSEVSGTSKSSQGYSTLMPWSIMQGTLMTHSYYNYNGTGGLILQDFGTDLPTVSSLFQDMTGSEQSDILTQAMCDNARLEDARVLSSKDNLHMLEHPATDAPEKFQTYMAHQQLTHQLLSRNMMILDPTLRIEGTPVDLSKLNTAHPTTRQLLHRCESFQTQDYLAVATERQAMQVLVMKLMQAPLFPIIHRSIREGSITSVMDVIALLGNDNNGVLSNDLLCPSDLLPKLDALIASCHEQGFAGMNTHLGENSKNPNYSSLAQSREFLQSNHSNAPQDVVLHKKNKQIV